MGALGNFRLSLWEKAIELADSFDFNGRPNKDAIRAGTPRSAGIDSIVLEEIKVLYPGIHSFGVSKIPVQTTGSPRLDTQKIALASFKKPLTKADVVKLRLWLQKRYQSPSLKLVTP